MNNDLGAALGFHKENLIECGHILAEKGTEVIICSPPPLRDDELSDPGNGFVLHEYNRIEAFALRAIQYIVICILKRVEELYCCF